MDEISVADLERMYLHSLIGYEGLFYYVKSISRDRVLALANPLTGKSRSVKFDLQKLIPPGNVGFINNNGLARYTTRVPRRIFYVGIADDNIKQKVIGYRGLIDRISVSNPSITYALYDLYPSLEEALELIVKGARSVAFNKQFAVDREHILYYKTSVVGVVKNGKCEFLPGKEFLVNLFRTEDVKNLRKATPFAT